ncbi:NTP transferase domain-containing protein [Candidatus Sumerlaeota bacterium]|nr:NTP transferase domain-containing protein [Candidatus Sumerlaeota bacterium]
MKRARSPSKNRTAHRVPSGTRAVVLAGGKGTRLLPYTTLLPKPLVPVGEHPILEYALNQLKRAGFRRVTMCVGHLAELIQAFFGDGRKWGIELDYSIEEKPLSTIGPLAFVEGLGEDFLVMNGDVLTDLNLADVFRAHVRAKADLTVATHRREVNIDYGVLDYDPKTLRIGGFTEKPSLPCNVSMGIYVLNRRCLDLVERGRPMGFDKLVLELLRRERKVMSFPYAGRWLDVGRPEDYALAQEWER